MTAEFYKNVYQKTFLPNDFNLRILGNKNVFEKFKIGWRHMLVPSLLSRNKFLVQQSNITPKHISKFSSLVQLCLISLLSSRCFIQDCTCLLFLRRICSYLCQLWNRNHICCMWGKRLYLKIFKISRQTV